MFATQQTSTVELFKRGGGGEVERKFVLTIFPGHEATLFWDVRFIVTGVGVNLRFPDL